MILNLSRRKMAAGRALLTKYAFCNALGFSWSADRILVLLALAYGASNAETGLLFAAAHITGLASVLVPKLCNGQETSRLWSYCWLMRATCGAGYLLLPLLSGGQVWVLIGIYYLFMLSRSFGMPQAGVVFKAMAPGREMPRFMGSQFAISNSGVLLAQVVSFLVLSSMWFGREESRFMLLLGLGVVFNAAAAWYLSRLPRTGYIDEGSFTSLVAGIKDIRRSALLREVAVLSFLQPVVMIFCSYHMNYLKVTLALPSGRIFLLIVIGMAGSIAVSNALRIVGARIGTRVMLIVIHSLLSVVVISWSLLGALPGFATSLLLQILFSAPLPILLGASSAIVFQLQAAILPAKRSVQISIIFQLAQAIAAVLVVLVVQTLPEQTLPMPMLHAYSLHFWCCAACCLGIAGFSFWLQASLGGEGIWESLTHFSPANLRCIYLAHRFESKVVATPSRTIALMNLLAAPSPTSRRMTLDALRSNDTIQQSAALRVLNASVDAQAFEDVLALALAPQSPLRQEAITTLGFLGDARAVEPLRALASGASPEIGSVAIKSLLRLEQPVAREQYLACYRACPDTSSRLNLLIGAAAARWQDVLVTVLAWELEQQPQPLWSRTVLQFVLGAWARRESVVEIFDEEDRKPGGGLEYIIADAEGDWPETLQPSNLRQLFSSGDYQALAGQLAETAAPLQLTIYDRSTALGVLFLWLQMRSGEPCAGAASPVVGAATVPVEV